ncbi:MAG: 3-isopropylmalate dehydratase large subunit [Pseudomonadota bacterium]
MSGRTLFDKLWDAHVVARAEGGRSLLWVDRHLVHEGSHHAFAKIGARGETLAQPELTFGVMDHYAPVRRDVPPMPAVLKMMERLADNAALHGFTCIAPEDQRHGIVHVMAPEQGLTLPGLLVVCGDSHTSTHGAFGAFAFGIGATEVAHVLATQTLWQQKPKRMRLRFDGALGPAVTAKDMALHWIAALGTGGARGHAIEYAGPAVEALSMEARMTLCNLSIEGGARCGMIAPDAQTLAYVKGRIHAPTGAAWAEAEADWAGLYSDTDAVFDTEVDIDAADVAPTVTWGTAPDQALPITATVPDPLAQPETTAAKTRDTLEYMGLKPGQALSEVTVDRIFIGSCTNARIEDLRAAAMVLHGRKSVVPGLVSPGSAQVKHQAEREGLDNVFTEAGLDWGGSGCSMCVGMNGDTVPAGQRCASTTNRNYRGRQGRGARTHLMSPSMVAAAAVTGRLTDVRMLLAGRA